MPPVAQVTGGWNAAVSQTGRQVLARAPAWAPDLAAGTSASIGIQASGPVATPAGFAVAGTACTT